MECWKNGKIEEWNDGVLAKRVNLLTTKSNLLLTLQTFYF